MAKGRMALLETYAAWTELGAARGRGRSDPLAGWTEDVQVTFE